MSNVFISYAKADNVDEQITRLVERLKQTASPIHPDTKIAVWFDESGIRKGQNFKTDIDIGLEDAHTVALFISPRYFASKVCNQELQSALTQTKRLIPVWVESVTAGAVEEEITLRQSQGKETAALTDAMKNYAEIWELQAIRFDTDTTPRKDRTFQELVAAIFQHPTLDDGAAQWLKRTNAKERGTGAWLSGADLRAAEAWLAAAKEAKTFIIHPPTHDYIIRSRRVNRRRRLMLTIAAVMAVIIIGIVSMIALQQSNERQQNAILAATSDAIARENAIRSESERLASLSENLVEENPSVSLLLALAANRTSPTVSAHRALTIAFNHNYAVSEFESEPSVFDTVISPDGLFFATFTVDCLIRFRDLQTNTLLGEYQAPDCEIRVPDGGFDNLTLMGYGAGGDVLVVLLADRVIGLNAETFTVAWEYPLPTHKDRFSKPLWIAISPLGDYVTTLDDNAHLLVLDARTGETRFNPEMQVNYAYASESAQKLVASKDTEVWVWDLNNFSLETTFTVQNPIDLIRLSRNRIVTSSGYILSLYRFNGEREVSTQTDHLFITSLTLTPDQAFIITSGSAEPLAVWNVSPFLQQVRSIPHKGNYIRNVTVSQDGKRVLLDDGVTQVLDLYQHLEKEYIALNREVIDAWIDPTHTHFAILDSDGEFTMWERASGKMLYSIPIENDTYFVSTRTVTLAFSPDGGSFYLLDGSNQIQHFQTATGDRLNAWPVSVNLDDLIVSPDGEIIAGRSRGHPPYIPLWKRDGSELASLSSFLLEYDDDVVEINFSADSKTLLIGTLRSQALLVLYDLASGQFSYVGINQPDGTPAEGAQSAYDVQMGRAYIHVNNDVLVWNLQTQSIENVITNAGMTDGGYASPVARDGYFITADAKGTLSVLRDNQPYYLPAGHLLEVMSLSYRDGEIISVGKDNSVRIWTLDLDHNLRKACARVFRDFTAAERTQFGVTEATVTCT